MKKYVPAVLSFLAIMGAVTMLCLLLNDSFGRYSLEELRGGNKEFLNAAEETLAALNAMDLPEVRYFLEQFAAGFGLTLDELT